MEGREDDQKCLHLKGGRYLIHLFLILILNQIEALIVPQKVMNS